MVKQQTKRRPSRLKRLFPLMAILIVILIVFWPNLRNLVKPKPTSNPVLISTIAQTHQKNPPKEEISNEARDLHFEGADKNGQPYTLTALQGTEFKEGTVELLTPKLTMKLTSGATVILSSDKAIYDKAAEKIELINNVHLVHSTGYDFTTQRAWLDMSTSVAYGHDPIQGQGPQGQIFAKDGFNLSDKGNKMSLKGRPELRLKKGAAQ